MRASHRTFNTAVAEYNQKVRAFPMNLLAGMFGFSQKEGFKAEPGAEKAPKVKF
ncbi:MAG: LemA family protein [Chitinophagaceae bacterium]|nr:LemA family protein [Chitinophagaceae bacterium]